MAVDADDRHVGHACFLECLQGAEAHVVVLGDHAVDVVAEGRDPVADLVDGLVALPVRRVLGEHLHFGVLGEHVVDALGTRLISPEPPSGPCRMMDVALAADGVHHHLRLLLAGRDVIRLHGTGEVFAVQRGN